MSTQRRRVLANAEAGIPIDKISNGVYIESVDGKAYKADDWQSGYTANSIAIASGDVKFRIALTEPSSRMLIGHWNLPLERYMIAISDSATAVSDYDGAGNTAKILQMQSYTGYAAGYCDAFIFPNGKTKGFLPSMGQLWLVYNNKADVDAALTACDGTAITKFNYRSSTFYCVEGDKRYCWELDLGDGQRSGYGRLDYMDYVRPFANIS